MSSPSVQPWKVPENLWNGLLCYTGYPVIVNGCHPDTMCTSYHVALWINLGVLCHVIYTVSVIVILQASSESMSLFFALTFTVLLALFAFNVPILPILSHERFGTLDAIGLALVIFGLVLYRFTNDSMTCSKQQRHVHLSTERDDETVLTVDGSVKFLSQRIQSSVSNIWMQVANQTSYTLLREPLRPDRS